MVEMVKYDGNSYPAQIFDERMARSARQNRTFLLADAYDSFLYDYIKPSDLSRVGAWEDGDPRIPVIYQHLRRYAEQILIAEKQLQGIMKAVDQNEVSTYLLEIAQTHVFIGTLQISLFKRMKDAGIWGPELWVQNNEGISPLISAVNRPTVPENLLQIFVMHELESRGYDVRGNLAFIPDMIEEAIHGDA